jgi:hypothetical protein
MHAKSRADPQRKAASAVPSASRGEKRDSDLNRAARPMAKSVSEEPPDELATTGRQGKLKQDGKHALPRVPSGQTLNPLRGRPGHHDEERYHIASETCSDRWRRRRAPAGRIQRPDPVDRSCHAGSTCRSAAAEDRARSGPPSADDGARRLAARSGREPMNLRPEPISARSNRAG